MRVFGRFFRSTTGKVAVGVLVGTLISVPAAVWAVTSFSDVPTSHPFYKEISAVAGAGIAQGFGDGTYKPANNITRQAMAAFMERGVGRAAFDNGVAEVRSSITSELAAVAMDAGATGAGTNGFVVLSGSVYATTSSATSANCPCTISVSLTSDDSTVATSFLQVPILPDGQDALGTATVETVLSVDGDADYLFRVVAAGLSEFGDDYVAATGSITATYVPLSGDGDSSEDYGLSCPKDDVWEPNDTQANASTYFMLSGQPTNAIVCSTSDKDWYTDYVEQDSTINVNLSFTHTEGDIDVCLFDSETVLACSVGGSNTEMIMYPLADEGFYWIQVFLFADLGTSPGNTYTLTASKT